MTDNIARLAKGQEPMSEEKWATHVDCDLAKREHKWHWKVDISSGMPSMDQAVCDHCGKETTLNREGVNRGVSP